MIAGYLDCETARIDELIAEQKALAAALAERREAIILRLVTHGVNVTSDVVESGIEWIGRVPIHWRWGSIRRFASMRSGHTPSRMPHPRATSQDFWNWVCGDELAPEYSMWVLKAMRQEFKILMRGSTHQTIYRPIAAGIRIPLPPLPEQVEIAAEIERATAEIDDLTSECEALIVLLKERRAALITAAVTGQIDVRTAN